METVSRSVRLINISAIISEQEYLLPLLRDLDDSCGKIEQFYHEYDFRPDIPGNGFRSFVKTVNLFFDKIEESTKSRKCGAKLMNEYVTMARTLKKCADLAFIVRKKGKNFNASEISALDMEFFIQLFRLEESEMAPLVGHVSFFNVKPCMDRLMKLILFGFNYTVASPWQKVKMLLSPSYRGQRILQSMVSMDMRTARAMTPAPPYMLWIRALNSLTTRHTRIRRVKAESRNKWLLTCRDADTPADLLYVNERTCSVDGLLIKPDNAASGNRKLLINMHGGGYMCVNATMSSGLMGHMAKLLQIPVFVPEYRKAPDHKFPAALQDVFDAYMFLTSGDPLVQQLLGFQPEEVILSGDSAGGHLCISLALTLNRVRKMMMGREDRERMITMPKAMAVQYACIAPCFQASASATLVPFDSLLSPGFLALAASSYAPTNPPITDDQWYTRKEDAASIIDIISRFKGRLTDPLFNLSACTEYGEVSGIPLFVLACEMDPILDHSVAIAHKWQGPLRFDIVPDVSHGFTTFHLHPGLRDEMQVYEDQVIAAVNYPIHHASAARKAVK